jgi:V8-like Glu-specific endopeptidase
MADSIDTSKSSQTTDNIRQLQRIRDIGELTFGPRDPAFALEMEAVKDQRQPVGNSIRKTPWRKICDLIITANDGTLHSGTAWFISPRTLVTAGHCLFVYKPGAVAHGLIRNIVVMPGS